MHVYPEIESWNEFYPSEIFIKLGDNEKIPDTIPVLKIANIGTKIYIGTPTDETIIYKKIGVIEDLPDVNLSLIIVGKAM